MNKVLGSIGGFSLFYALIKINGSNTQNDYFTAKLTNKIKLNDTLRVLSFERTEDASIARTLVPENLGVSYVVAIDSGNIYRYYTPLVNSPNSFDILLKVYPDGYFSSRLDALTVSDREYFIQGKQVLEINRSEKSIRNLENNQVFREIKNIIFISTGTGIAPLLQLKKQASLDKTFHFKAIHFSTREDVRLSQYLTNQVGNLTFLIQEKNQTISFKTLKKYLQPDDNTAIIICGTSSLLTKCCGEGHEDGKYLNQPQLGGILKEIGFSNNQVFRL